jgi:hypothetical protein
MSEPAFSQPREETRFLRVHVTQRTDALGGSSCCRDYQALVPLSHIDCPFGSIEGVFTADASALTEVPGIGAKKAVRIRELVR